MNDLKYLLKISISFFMALSSCIEADDNVIGSPRLQLVFPDDVDVCREGSVLVGFNVEDDGGVVDVHVIESTPPGIFDQAATETVKRMDLPSAAGKKGLSYRIRYSPREECQKINTGQPKIEEKD